jgi:hypothetical protein
VSVVDPFSEAEMDRILSEVPQNRARVKARVLSATRDYLLSLDRPNKKANPRQEIGRLEDALHSLARALSGLSRGATEHLARLRNDSPAYEDPIDPWGLGIAVHRFLIENKGGLVDKPAPPRSGPIVHHQKRRLDERLELAFEIGHGGVRQKNGYPKFRDLCIGPAVLQLRALIGEPKKWQDLRRNNPRKIPGK